MPPSPSLRCSPGREHRMENTHKRGHSFESGLTLRAKDDDLTLFNDMQNRERESFLLHTADDFDDSLCNVLIHPSKTCRFWCSLRLILCKFSFSFSFLVMCISKIKIPFRLQAWDHYSSTRKEQRSVECGW